MAAQIVITADANPVDEGLRRRLDAMLGLERIGFRARRQPAVVDREAPAFQQMLRLQPIGADMVLHDHAMEDCLFRHGVPYSIRTMVRSQAMQFTIGKLAAAGGVGVETRSEEHTSELQSLMRISYAVFCLKKKKRN